jgi:tRNA (cytidine56-2'-O)-methyltransferase
VARSFGAEGAYIVGSKDDALRGSIKRVIGSWGGSFWIEFINNPLRLVKEWKSSGGKVAHLTMYGMQIKCIKDKIASLDEDLLVVIGGEKVPFEYYSSADFNVAIGNQPHSEVAALAIFLDRVTCGRWENTHFKNAQIRIIPSEKGKNVEQLDLKKKPF